MFQSLSQDRRLQPRSAASGRGVVIAPGLEIGCVIADTSSGGMRVRLDRQIALPAQVVVVDVEAGQALSADVAWRQGMEIGVKRQTRDSLRGLVPSRLLPAREAWLRAGGR